MSTFAPGTQGDGVAMDRRQGTGEWLAAVHAGATTLSPNRATVVGFDLEGRPHHWLVAGETFKRSLSSEVFGRRTEAGVRKRWRVESRDAAALFLWARDVARAAQAALERGEVRLSGKGASADTTRQRLADIVRWNPERLEAERERYLRAYRPVSILPPDQYQSVVLQATYGCSWNRCAYCTFYQDRAFSVRTPEAFEPHLAAVRELLGASAEARRSVFFGDGNALVLANRRLLPLMEMARDAFPGRPLAGFVDVFSGEKKRLEEWRALRALGLRSVAIGVETGHDPLLSYLNKPGSADEAADFVATLKEAGLAVSVILMVGAGGTRFAEGHLRDSAALLGRLPLTEGDVVYLSPFVVQSGSPYAERAARDGTVPLSEGERDEQYRALKAAARLAAPASRVALYHIDEFVY
ncbi:MAG: radical SAM protein [Trueperaceae bacterium]